MVSASTDDVSMARVLARFGPAYMQRHGRTMPVAHRAAMNAILMCRTPALGANVVECEDCKVTEFVYHSCRHRACPKCGSGLGDDWVEARREEILPVPYFQIVFTVPEELRRIIRRHQCVLYPKLMTAAGETLLEVGADPEHVGGQIGALTVLHTWTRTVEYHPHIHCLVPAGYLDDAGEWHEVSRPWFAPQEVLASVFRAKLVAAIRAAVPGLRLPGPIFHTPWVVHVDKPKHGTEVVLRYLARYVHRVALSDHRIVAMSTTHVTFKYRDRDRKNWLTMTLRGPEFVRRFLQHVLPRRFHKVRYFGFWACSNRPKLRELRQKLLAQAGQTPASSPPSGAAPQANPSPTWLKCPHCEQGTRSILGHFDAIQLHDYFTRHGFRPPDVPQLL